MDAEMRATDAKLQTVRVKPAVSRALTVTKSSPTIAKTVKPSPLARRVSNLEAYLCNPRYHEAYLRNFGRHLPVPRATASPGSISNKTLPAMATVQNTYLVQPGFVLFIAPLSEDLNNRPFIMATNQFSGNYSTWDYSHGNWFGGRGPQSLFGAVPPQGIIDSRGIQFKGGQVNIDVSAPMNTTGSIAVLDPYNSLLYGKATGLEQTKYGPSPTAQYNLGDQDSRPYYGQMAIGPNVADFTGNSQNFAVVGGSQASTWSSRQVLRPHAHVFTCPVSGQGPVSPPAALALGFVDEPENGVTALNYLQQFAQGIYCIQNPPTSTAAIAVTITGDWHYRSRIDMDAPAIYMMADDKTVPPSSIEFEPRISTGLSSAMAAAAQSAQHTPLRATQRAHIQQSVPVSVAAIDAKAVAPKENGGFIPSLSGGVKKAFGGLERAWTKGDNVGDLVGGLGEFTLGTLEGIGSILSIL